MRKLAAKTGWRQPTGGRTVEDPMRRVLNSAVLLLVVATAAGALAWWRHRPAGPARPKPVETPVNAPDRRLPPATADGANAADATSAAARNQAARVAAIQQDYDDMRRKFAAEYAANRAPTRGLQAFLNQLALLESERRKDLLKVVTPAELEELEMRDSNAGKLVQHWLGDTSATDEQRRQVFRLQRDFDDRYGLTFDLSPEYLLARERDRQGLQDRIRQALGDDLFVAWLRAEGPDVGRWKSFVIDHGLPASTALDLWRTQNALTLGRLEVKANRALTPQQADAARTDLARRTDLQVRSLLGAAALDPAAAPLLSWVPKP